MEKVPNEASFGTFSIHARLLFLVVVMALFLGAHELFGWRCRGSLCFEYQAIRVNKLILWIELLCFIQQPICLLVIPTVRMHHSPIREQIGGVGIGAYAVLKHLDCLLRLIMVLVEQPKRGVIADIVRL